MLPRVRSYRYIHLDVFTDRPLSGNQLAVFLDGRGLEPSTMQAIAKEMNFSETTFVLPSERSDTDCRVRIFTPAAELPMAGHPTVGTAFALARSGIIEPGCDRVVFGLGIGPTPLAFTWHDEELAFAWMTQGVPEFGAPIPDPAGAAAALRLPSAAITSTGLPVQTVSCGVPFLYIPLATRRAVDSASLDSAAYEQFLRAAHLEDLPVFLFSSETGGDKATVYSRMFAPALGIAEDPATGVASGPLGSYLVRHRVVPPERAGAMLSLQGVKMGRSSQIHIAIGVKNGDIQDVRIGGQAVVAGEGNLYL
jgi:trans-2,3-dihydro-3-hydroxyanthranilate isomerase